VKTLRRSGDAREEAAGVRLAIEDACRGGGIRKRIILQPPVPLDAWYTDGTNSQDRTFATGATGGIIRLMKTISMVMLGVEDAGRSVAFYRDTIGLALQHNQGGFAFFGAGGITLALNEQLGRAVDPIAGAMEIIFPVESVTAQQSILEARGCGFINEPREVTPGSWAVSFTDPDGHRLTLFGPH
jgi:predicted enzyme related to lactoylglutathione lyase